LVEFLVSRAGHIAKFTTQAKSLTSLNMSYNLIEDEGAIAIAGSLWSSPLKTLILTSNEIGRVGGAAVAKALQGKSNISTLIMDGNNVAQSLKDIVVMLQVNATLTSLSYNSCRFTDQDIEDMARALYNNSTLQVR
jgi:Ran GTPase-activating protein (RanGAP) involved in mRNA processing and transport